MPVTATFAHVETEIESEEGEDHWAAENGADNFCVGNAEVTGVIFFSEILCRHQIRLSLIIVLDKHFRHFLLDFCYLFTGASKFLFLGNFIAFGSGEVWF